MAKADDEMSTYASGGAGEKRPFRPGSTLLSEARRNASCLNTHQCESCARISATAGKSELEQMMKQMKFTRSEAQHFISLLNSRITEEEESTTRLSSIEASTSGSKLKKFKHGDERDNFHASIVTSRVLEEEIASQGSSSTIGIGEALRQDSKSINNNATSTFLSITSMASPQQPATMENLPEELLSNIFIRLLAKQLAQMRSVNKSWNALLSHPSFVKSHLNRSIRNDQILLVFHEDGDSKYFTAKPSRSPCVQPTDFIKLPVNPQIQSEYIYGIDVIGAVNGLICSSYSESVIQIWNPSLSAVLTLPPYSTPSCGDNPIATYFRFGYDPKTDDYKVVKLTGLHGRIANVMEWWLQVEIYSMRKGCWELITERFPSHIPYIIEGDCGCVDGHDGHLHWLGENKDAERRIVAFDLGSETFREIPLPYSTLNRNRSNELGILAEKLCLMSCIIENDVYEMWVMEEYGVAESWVKRRVFSQFSDSTCLFGFTSHNEFLIEDDYCLFLYDPSSNEQKILKDHCPVLYGVDKIVEYVDSLVWISSAEHEIVVGGGQN